MTTNKEVTIIDYGVGNILSVQRGFEHCGAVVNLTSDPEQILAAKRVVLPGVGAFSHAMRTLEKLDLVLAIKQIVQRQTPLLGICLGMQLLLDESEEFGTTPGLSLIPGRVVPIPAYTTSDKMQKIPHIGWSTIQPTSTSNRWSNTLLQDNQTGEAAYFVHSFMVIPEDSKHNIASCVYGGHKIPAVIRRDKITGCQFHPEKSGEVGLKILLRFILT